MCNCQDTEGFEESLSKAKLLTEETGETHVAYVHHAVKKSFVRNKKDLNDDLNICCYFLPDGTEVEYKSKTKTAEKVQAKELNQDVEANQENKMASRKATRKDA